MSKGLIVGGGIAGLGAAIALARAGVQCDVVELGEAPAGASLSLSGRAADALDELGIYDECLASGAPFTAQMASPVMNDAAGRPLGAPAARPAIAQAKQPLGVFRPVFAGILERNAQGLGASLRKGVTVERLVDDGDDLSTVAFSDGTTKRYEFVIGADGIASTTRAALFPDAASPAYSGQMSVRWMIPGPALDGEGWYVGAGGRLGFFHMPRQSLVYAPMVFTLPESRLTQADAYELVKRFLDTFSAPAVVNLRQRLRPDSSLICRPFRWHLLQAPWYRGRSLLIGDAAHATTAHMGMGAGMALEDAVVLAQCIAKAPTLQQAYASFMDRRYERVRIVVETSLALSKMEQSGASNADYMAKLGAAYAQIARPY
ncbi:MAG: FAD-dependent monooxygenase [Proteobacteria bacterium]|nr:FAD-dependent monooxygenase [Pseudomonadota bacterium]